MNAEAIVYHIRSKPADNRRGNQYYRDKRALLVLPLCGADPGLCDVRWNENAPSWTRESDGQAFEPCGKCLEMRSDGNLTP